MWEKEYERFNKSLVQQENDLAEKDQRIVDLEELLQQENSLFAEKDARVVELEAQVERRDDHIIQLQEELAARDRRIDDYANADTEKQQRISSALKCLSLTPLPEKLWSL
jgi:chromosome segregation ATPase